MPVEEFSEDLKKFIEDLEEIFRSFLGCMGIAAPQVGRFERIVPAGIFHKPKHFNKGFLLLINPVIIFWREVVWEEGLPIGSGL